MDSCLRSTDLPVPVLTAATLPIAGLTVRFPVRRIYCVGRNYVEHIREMKEGDERDPPFFFQKPSDAVVEDGATIAYPADTDDFQFEIELVVALGAGGRNFSRGDALEAVFGYAVGISPGATTSATCARRCCRGSGANHSMRRRHVEPFIAYPRSAIPREAASRSTSMVASDNAAIWRR
jgi:hypothetical protein